MSALVMNEASSPCTTRPFLVMRIFQLLVEKVPGIGQQDQNDINAL